MTPQEAWKLLQERKIILVDVREREELEESGTAEGALWMPTSEMAEDSDQWRDFRKSLPSDKPIVLFCRSGNRSGRVAEFLCCDGLQAVNLGGFSLWCAAGMPVKPFKSK